MMSAARSSSSRFPFTASQWQELEHQALIFKYMVSGMSIPPDLLFTIKRSLDSSLSSKLILHQPQHLGWNCFQMGFGRKIDPEPGRCRRTDGKKWRCSKEAYPDSKYCERHMHRGRNRSRKPVEVMTTSTTTNTSNISSMPTAIPISSITRNPNSSPSLSSIASDGHHHHSHPCYSSTPLHNPFLYPSSSSSKPPGIGFSSQENTNFLLQSGPFSQTDKDYRNVHGNGMKEDVDEHAFFSESSGTMRSMSGSSAGDSWHLEPLTMSGSAMKQRTCSSLQSGYSYLQLQSLIDSSKQKQDQHYYVQDDGVKFGIPLKMERENEPQKVMHHFFDEGPKDKDSWLNSEDKLSNHGHASATQLSISTPKSSHYDFFMTRNEK